MEAALRALAVALLVWAGLRLFRVRNVPAQKAAWGLVLVCAMAMPMVMRWEPLPASFTMRVPVSRWRPAAKPSAAEAETEPIPATVVRAPAPSQMRSVAARKPLPVPGNRFPAPAVSKSKFSPSRQNPPGEAQVQPTALHEDTGARGANLPLQDPGTTAVFLYVAVCAILLFRLIYGLAMAVRLWLVAERFEPDLGTDPESNPALGLRLRFSFSISSPVTIGSGVLLPAECLGWDREKLRVVLAHERAHVRQGDFYLLLAASLYSAIFWISPLGWWLKRKLSDLGEAISDRAGLEEAASRASYAQVLLEFAALPRPTVLGVAMARSTNLSHRIEWLLNESSFRQAFAGRRRMLVSLMLVPVALFLGTALVRVEVAASGQAVQPPPPASAAAPNPAHAPVGAPNAAPAPAAAPALAPPSEPDGVGAAPLPSPMPLVAPMPPGAAIRSMPAVIAVGALAPMPPIPPMPVVHVGVDVGAGAGVGIGVAGSHVVQASESNGTGRGYSYSYSSDGDSWALVTDPSEHVTFSGDWHNSTRESIEKTRKLTGGKFLWFSHDGKNYFVNDPATVAQIEAMYKPMEALSRQQEALGKQQEELGRQQEELGKKQEQASIPTPDISKEMAELNAAVAKLNAKKGSTVSQEELADIEGKLGDIQGRLGELQGEMGEQQGKLGEMQGKLGEQQGRLGEEQGRLGEQQGRISEEADRKVRSIINQSLHDGKARPVE
jgi:beta-lactamase regulating signal transducer with metallopeptidase domain